MQRLSTAEVAARWNCSQDYVRKLIREGILKRSLNLSTGSRPTYRVDLREVERFESSRTQKHLENQGISKAALNFCKTASNG